MVTGYGIAQVLAGALGSVRACVESVSLLAWLGRDETALVAPARLENHPSSEFKRTFYPEAKNLSPPTFREGDSKTLRNAWLQKSPRFESEASLINPDRTRLGAHAAAEGQQASCAQSEHTDRRRFRDDFGCGEAEVQISASIIAGIACRNKARFA